MLLIILSSVAKPLICDYEELLLLRGYLILA